MTSASRRTPRGFTLLEIVAVFVVVAIMGAVAVVSFKKFADRTEASQTYQAIRAVAAAQETLRRTRGHFATTQVELKEIEAAYTYTVDGFTPSTALDTMSVAVSADAEAFGVATLNSNGECVTIRQYQPRADRTLKDSRGLYLPTSLQPCTGAQALLIEGVAW